MSRSARIAGLALLATLATGALALHRGWITLPPEYSPWVPLDVAAPPNFMTRWKLARLSGDAAACHAVLVTTGLDYEVLTDKETGRDCGLHDAVRVRRTASMLTGEEFSLTCRAAVSLAMWERHALQPAAAKHLAQPVSRIEHFGSYSCRNVYGRPDATRSRHATAEAWDVAGFVMADGRRIRVVRDWTEDSPEAAFLHAARDGACRFFDGVFSPDYNAAHRDHLHLDRGPYRICR